MAFIPAAAGTYESFKAQRLAWVWLGFAGTLVIIVAGAVTGYRSRHTHRGFAAAIQSSVATNSALFLAAGVLGLLHGPVELLLAILATMLLAAAAAAIRFARSMGS